MDNKEILNCFEQPQDVERWTCWMKNGVAPWTKDRPKSHRTQSFTNPRLSETTRGQRYP